jgi:ABC transporter substrate binding protein (PQQ-dependent alcohol dehydrogenase system)
MSSQRLIAGCVRLALLSAAALGAVTTARAADPLDVVIGYLHRSEPKTALSLLDVPPDNDGVAGASLAIDDDNTTGRFLQQHYRLDEVRLGAEEDAGAGVAVLAARGVRFIVLDLPPDEVLKASGAGRDKGLLFFNAGATDDRLREQECRANVVHVAPTRSMLADGLAQYLVWKQWRRWLLVVGSHPADQLYAEALRRAATRFGGKIVQERVFQDAGGARRTDSGTAQVQRQIPVFTQQAPAYDVLVAADESEVFAAYLPYRTWDPRPVAGSAGLMAKSWDAAHDQWGAVQMQNRFIKQFSRRMTPLDMQAWTAVRMVGEGVARTGSADPVRVLHYLVSPGFGLGAFKGQALTLRPWNLQLRQPIILTDGRIDVSVSPQEGFLHQVSELDTLGYDRPETKCALR